MREELLAAKLIPPPPVEPQPPRPGQQWLAHGEACDLVGISGQVLEAWRRKGFLVGYKQRDLIADGRLDPATVRPQSNKVYFKFEEVLKAKLEARRKSGLRKPPSTPSLPSE